MEGIGHEGDREEDGRLWTVDLVGEKQEEQEEGAYNWSCSETVSSLEVGWVEIWRVDVEAEEEAKHMLLL